MFDIVKLKKGNKDAYPLEVPLSSNERVIGKWIDGRPLYRKVLTFGTLPNNSTLNVYMNVDNLDVVVKYFGIANSTRYALTLPTAQNSIEKNVNVFIDYLYKFIGIQTFSDRTTYTSGYIIIDYVKKAT